MISFLRTLRRLSLRPSSMVLTRHPLPETFPALCWHEEDGAGTLFILRRWGLVINTRAGVAAVEGVGA